MHALHRYRCRWAWVSSKPSRTTVLLPHAGQWTPSGQRCWRTRAKHLASSISAERLTRSDTAIFEGPHAGWPARAVLADYHRGPAGTLPRPPPTAPEPNKSLNQILLTETIPLFTAYNPAAAEVNTKHVFQTALTEMVNGSTKAEDAAAKALNQCKEIFAKYPIQNS